MDATVELELTRMAERTRNDDLPEVLALRYRYTREQIMAAGLTERLTEAESKKVELMLRAASALAPLGISLPALSRFVSDVLRNRSLETDE
jgi:hypothetical protein